MNTPTDIILNNEWNFYFHDPNNSSWDISSYTFLDKIISLNQWITVFQSFKNAWNKGMFFLMRGAIQPIWEDDKNKDGGCISFKLWKTDVNENWFELSGKLIGEVLLNNNKQMYWDKINGISITPKRSYCVIRIWLYSDIIKDVSIYNIKPPSYSKMIYKSHSENKDYKENDI
jgi:hypothetical protein